MERESVESTSLRSVGYEARTQTLEVEFNSGGIYRYLAVPPEMYRTLRESDSLGRVFARQIRNAYECWKLVRPKAAG